LQHVHRCPSCQATVGELSEIADLLLQLAPEADPPAGFERLVLDGTRRDRRTRRRWMATVAAVAAAAVIGAVALVRIVDAGRTPDGAATAALETAPMRDASGLRVGRVVTTSETPARAVVTVDYAIPDGTYDLVVGGGPGSSDSIGSMTVRDGEGEWRGEIESPDRATLAMVDDRGTVVCRATL
jgi:hypothetical protein